MKKIVVLIILFGFISCSNHQNKKDSKVEIKNANFYVKLIHVRRERSKDSNYQKSELIINDEKLFYSIEHGGRDPRSDMVKKYQLNTQKIKIISDYIVEKKLNVDIKEKRKLDDYGITIKIELDIKINNKVTHLSIEGQEHYWGKKRDKESNIKNIELVSNVKGLFYILKSKVGIKEIEL